MKYNKNDRKRIFNSPFEVNLILHENNRYR